MSDFSAVDNALRSLESIPLARVAGRLVRLNGILLESVGCPLMTGQLCRIESANHTLIDAQAVGFNRDITYLMPFKQPVGLMAGARVFPEEKAHDILIGESWLGRVVNGLGEPLDGKGRLNGNDLLPPLPPSVNPLTRRSVDEPPATKGYPPSAFGMIPKLVESAGNSESAGSMTAIYTVLAEGDDQQDPIVDCARAVLDGHIVLTRKLAEAGHYPAIDIGQSISRCMNQVTSLEHQQSARALKQNYAAYMEIKPLIPLGGYVAGADASVDKAVKMFPAIERFLRQEMREPASLELVQSRLQILFPCAKKAEQ
ncbi:flagellum-specific ATP synthase FliI [Escherichia coli]